MSSTAEGMFCRSLPRAGLSYTAAVGVPAGIAVHLERGAAADAPPPHQEKHAL